MSASLEATLGPASFVMVLIGCTQGQQCSPIMTLPVAYRSESSCLAARFDIIEASSDLGYDRLVAECRRQPQPASSKAEAGSVSTA